MQRKQQAKSAATLCNAVFLVGFMGAGKTSVGQALGQRLNWIFEDLDDRIERVQGRTVREIFRDSGEQAFRQAEHVVLQEMLEELRAGAVKVIALGGGAFVQPGNADLLKRSGVTAVFLDAPVEELWQRCCKRASVYGSERPLLRSLDQFRALYESRRRDYAKASLKIETGSRTVEAIAAEIAQVLGLKKKEPKEMGMEKIDLKKTSPKKIAIRIEQGEAE
jgi:shikimate kinase